MLLFCLIFSALPNKYEISCDDHSTVLESEQIESQDYLPLKPVTEILDINYVLNNANQRLYLTGNGHKCALIGNVSVIAFDSIFQHIPYAPYYLEGQIYFPAQAIIATLARPFKKLAFVKKIEDVPMLDKISVFTRGDSTVLQFTWKNPIDFDVQFSLKKAIIEIDGKYEGNLKAKGIKSIKEAKLLPYNTYTRVELDMADINSFFERTDEVVFYKKVRKMVRLVVIDPGHGGVDPGAVGKKGLYEKDVNLPIAKRLKDLLEDSLKIDVLLTRETDSYRALKERTNIANRNGADLFISIHCNSSAQIPKSQGFETFFLSEAKTDEARAAAALENAALKFDGVEPSNEISFILYDLAQNAFLQESNTFAECIQNAAEKDSTISNRGVSQAGFYVLRDAFMPAVLVETAFISNFAEEKLLRQKSFRNKLAYRIFQGIRNFVVDYERRLNN